MKINGLILAFAISLFAQTEKIKPEFCNSKIII